ncbi:MAG: ATP phosphoribosyltransferase regulatory subunit [Candidatus Liptonbacteria bacterium]|nr:ATP phosphoribosyltransferase regulatory subunit [Candidatus Liptonbacteria bacterium]
MSYMNASKTNAGKSKMRASLAAGGTATRDVLPVESVWWEKIRVAARQLAASYNFRRIETPLFERVEILARGFGEREEVIGQELFLVRSRGGAAFAVRPEGTIPVLRAYLEHSLGRVSQPQKLFFSGKVAPLRRSVPEGFRELNEISFHIVGGTSDPVYDAQTALVFHHLLRALKIKGVFLKLNMVGCKVCTPFYRRQLQSYFGRHEKEMCVGCAEHVKVNPLRVFACRKEKCVAFHGNAPNILDRICSACTQHLERSLEYVDELKVEYTLDSRWVGTKGYYSKIVFALAALKNPAIPIAEGGRCDYLMEALGGRVVSAVAGTTWCERLVAAMHGGELPKEAPAHAGRRVFVVHVGDLAKRRTLELIESLRGAGVPADEALGRESLRAQLKIAEREGYALALIVGQREIYEGSVIVRDLRSSVQETIMTRDIAEEVKQRLKDA